MSRKEKVTQDLVNTTCNDMHEAEEKITVSAVIKKIGGSFSTVGEMVKNWKTEQEKTKNTKELEMPDTVNTALKKAVAEIWKTASDIATQEVQQARQEADKIVSEAKGELIEALAEITRLENVREKNNIDKEEAEKKASTLLSKFSEITASNKVLEARLEDRESELQKQQKQQDKKITYFENEIKQLNATAEKNRSTLQAEFFQMKTQNSISEERLEEKAKELQKNQKQHRADISKLESRIKRNDTTKATAEKKLSSLQAEKNTIEKQSKNRESEFQKLHNQYEKLQNELLEIAKQKTVKTPPKKRPIKQEK